MVTLNPAVQLPLDKIAAICREYGVRELAIFGSALREDFNEQSDLDFLVQFEPDARVGFMELAGLQFAIEDVVGRPVDLVPKNGLKPLIRDDVLDSAQIIYAQ